MQWQQKMLGEIARLDRQSVMPVNIHADTSYLGLEHIDSDGKIELSENVASADIKSSKFKFSERHILFGKLRPYLRKIARPTFQGVCSTDIIPILPGEELFRDYLFYFLRTPSMVELATSRCSGANLPRLSPSQLASLQIPLPPLPEQKRIAKILDAADDLRAKRRESIAQLDALIQSTFLDMFGDPVMNPKGWEVVSVEGEISFLTSGSRGWASYYSETGDLFIRIQNLKKGQLDLSDTAFVKAPESAESKRTQVQPGDVLLSITADLGRSAVVPHGIMKAHINQHLAILRFKNMNPVFVSHQLASKGGQIQFDRLNREGVKAGLNFNDVKSIKLTKPPLDLQQRFASIVESIERQKARLRSHLAELDTLFASLQHRAFNGEL
ncbi:MAG: restriction endonuclease subunit S [Desulfovibrionales bacterium]|nr:MAG: restriction endonuclease subunit S [Desulfovibrionales bacterium]